MERDENSKIFNPKYSKNQRRYLRNNMTKAEVILWSSLKGEKLGYKFRRQHGIGNYIVDFYCPELKLVIEVDGESHYTNKGSEHDKRRTEFLNNLGITVLRFTNPQIKQNLNDAIQHISSFVKKMETKNDLN